MAFFNSEILKAFAIGAFLAAWLVMIFWLLVLITQPVPCRPGFTMVNGYCAVETKR